MENITCHHCKGTEEPYREVSIVIDGKRVIICEYCYDEYFSD